MFLWILGDYSSLRLGFFGIMVLWDRFLLRSMVRWDYMVLEDYGHLGIWYLWIIILWDECSCEVWFFGNIVLRD